MSSMPQQYIPYGYYIPGMPVPQANQQPMSPHTTIAPPTQRSNSQPSSASHAHHPLSGYFPYVHPYRIPPAHPHVMPVITEDTQKLYDKVGSVHHLVKLSDCTQSVADSGTSCHMLNDIKCFDHIWHMPSAYVILVDKA
eukprot:5688135-Ditylum_brightwellii.AAC.2